MGELSKEKLERISYLCLLAHVPVKSGEDVATVVEGSLLEKECAIGENPIGSRPEHDPTIWIFGSGISAV